jgi:hypothetical protein
LKGKAEITAEKKENARGRGDWGVPIWEEYPHTPAVFVRVANAGLRGYRTLKSIRRMEDRRAEVWDGEKIEIAARLHRIKHTEYYHGLTPRVKVFVEYHSNEAVRP